MIQNTSVLVVLPLDATQQKVYRMKYSEYEKLRVVLKNRDDLVLTKQSVNFPRVYTIITKAFYDIINVS